MHKLRELSLPIRSFKILPPSFFQWLTSLKSLSFRYQGSRTDEDGHIYDEDEDEHIYDEVASFLTQSSSLPLRILKIERCPIKKVQVPPTSNDLCFPWLEKLHIYSFYRLEKMQVMSPNAFPSIQVLKITSCHSLKRISGLEHLQSLVELIIDHCSKLEEVIQVGGDKTLSDHSPAICFPSIRVLKISRCHSLKRISGLEHLQSLVKISIGNCIKLEEVIQVGGDKTLSDHSPAICFPKLEKLGLWHLPQLKSICSDAISFPSLRKFVLTDCPELRVLPRGLVKENKAPEEHCYIEGGREWKNKLQWQDEDFKAALHPHIDIKESSAS